MLLPFYFHFVGRCYCQWLVADVIPLRLMLLPIVYFIVLLADVIAIICGRCYCHFMLYERMLSMADVIAMYVW